MSDLLTIEETARAKAMGWELTYIYDLDTGKFSIKVWPVSMTNVVLRMAQTNDSLGLKAMRLVTHGIKEKK